MRNKLLIVLAFVLICITSKVQAYSFSAVAPSGQTLYYNIISSTSVYVTSGSIDPIGAVIIPDTVLFNGNKYAVTSIGNYAFSGCSGLTSVTIGNSITLVGEYAFLNCGLASLIIPNSVTSIGCSAFEGCGVLNSVTIGNSINGIRSNTFYRCSNLTSIAIPNSINYIENYAFAHCDKLTSVTIPNSVTYIGSFVFQECTSLTSIIIPNSVISFGNFVFDGCSALNSVTIPNSITSIGKCTFSECTSLTTIKIPNSVTSIGEKAFYHCSGLTSITIPNPITSIGDYAFYYCSNLTSITCKALNPPLINYSTFSGVTKTIPVYVPCGAKSNYQSDSFWNIFTNFIGFDSITHYDTICQGQSYTNFGFNFSADTSGLYTQNLQTISGCDSIIKLNLIVYSRYHITYTDSICQGQTYTNFGFNFVADTTGVYNQSLQTINGCDSIITLNLTVNPIYSTTNFDTICQGQTYNNYGFNFIADTTGIYIQNLQTINGCDSIITLNLTVNHIPATPNLSIDKKSAYLEITWDSVGNSFEVYRDDSLIATTSQSIYQDTNVLNDSSYCYKVKAFIGNCESDFSDISCMKFVGLNDISINNQDISLYPNPTNGKAKLSILSLNDKAQVIIFDLTGRVLKTYIIDTNQKELEIDLSGFAKGVYNISINSNNTNISKKLVIQ